LLPAERIERRDKAAFWLGMTLAWSWGRTPNILESPSVPLTTTPDFLRGPCPPVLAST